MTQFRLALFGICEKLKKSVPLKFHASSAPITGAPSTSKLVNRVSPATNTATTTATVYLLSDMTSKFNAVIDEFALKLGGF
jgi:hypothetical protein